MRTVMRWAIKKAITVTGEPELLDGTYLSRAEAQKVADVTPGAGPVVIVAVLA